MIKSTDTKVAVKPRTKRALVQLKVTGVKGEFPSVANLEAAVQLRATALGYQAIGAVEIDAASTPDTKIINIAATDIETAMLIGILDDVLKTMVAGGYSIELSSVNGPVTMQMSLKRVTKREAKALRAAAAEATKVAQVAPAAAKKTVAAPVAKVAAVPVAKSVVAKTNQKSVVVAKSVKPTKGFTLIGRRTGAYKKIAREYAKRDLTAATPAFKAYNASGTDGVDPATEAKYAAVFANAAYGYKTEASGSTITVDLTGYTGDVSVVDSNIAAIAVGFVKGAKTEANTATMIAWRDAHPSVYLVTTDDTGYYIMAVEGSLVDVPELA